MKRGRLRAKHGEILGNWAGKLFYCHEGFVKNSSNGKISVIGWRSGANPEVCKIWTLFVTRSQQEIRRN